MNKTKNNPNQIRGFTLMEILVAMAIMAILAGVGFGSYSSSLKRSRDAQRKSGLEQLQKALENFVNDNGVYPDESTNHRMLDNNGAEYPWGGSFDYVVQGTLQTTGVTVQYMKILPKDPNSGGSYQYYASDDRKKYVIYAALENDRDPAIVGGLGVDCGSVACNYVVMSSNLATPSALNE